MIKAFVNNKERVVCYGACLYCREGQNPQKNHRSQTHLQPINDLPSKLDQHEPSHSRLLHVDNDTCFNMMKCNKHDA